MAAVAGEKRERLDRGKIVREALAMLDEVGLDALSTRGLADWLGVQSPALYWHFKNMRDLLDAVADLMLQEADWPAAPTPGEDAAQWLAERARVFRRALLAHRDGARVHAGTRPSHGQLPSITAQITALTAAGFNPADAARATLAVSRFTIGWVLEEQAASAAGAERGAYDLGSHPELEAARAVFEQRDPDTDFEYGLNALVTGLAMPRQH